MSKYTLVDEHLSKEEFEQKYGQKSFGYTNFDGIRYKIVAISDFQPQFLRGFLWNDGVDFDDVETTKDHVFVNEIW